MTDEQINRVIAESLEPKPADLVHNSLQLESPLKIWFWGFDGGWKHRNFLTDPAMRDLLQAKLLEEGWTITLNSRSETTYLFAEHGKKDRCFDVTAARERIWALAYMKAHGLEGE